MCASIQKNDNKRNYIQNRARSHKKRITRYNPRQWECRKSQVKRWFEGITELFLTNLINNDTM